MTEPKPTAIKTLRVRVRDKHAAVLRAMAYETNQVWNYCAELRERVARERGQWLSGYDLQQDALHKFSTALVERCAEIYVGNVSASKPARTNMAKSVLDAGWSSLRAMLEYKARQRGIVYREIEEAYTTRARSECGALGGPRGLKGLGMREWACVECGARHDRDVSAARNIPALGRGRAPLAGGIPCLQAG